MSEKARGGTESERERQNEWIRKESLLLLLLYCYPYLFFYPYTTINTPISSLRISKEYVSRVRVVDNVGCRLGTYNDWY